MKKRIAFLLVLSVIVMLVLPACSTKRDSPVLRVGTRVHNGMYNPLYAVTVEDRDVCDLIYEGLTDITSDGSYAVNERLVDNYLASEDGSMHTFVLKKNVKFADGSPMTADDIVFTYQTLSDKSGTAGNKRKAFLIDGAVSYMKGDSDKFMGVEALSDRVVRFKFIKNDPTNLEACSVKILSKAYYPDIEPGKVDLAMYQKIRNPLGSGPYVINDITDNGIVLHRNPSYWAVEDSNYLIDTIEINYYSDIELAKAFADGTVDFTPEIGSLSTLMELKTLDEAGSHDLDFVMYDSDRYGYLGFNTSIWYSKSTTIRKAIGYAFNRDEFIKNYFGDYASRIDTPLSPDSDLFEVLNNRVDHYNYSPEKAREILESVNYTWDEEGIMSFEGSPVKLTFYADVSDMISESLLDQFKSDMKDIGVEVVVEYFDATQLGVKLREYGEDVETNWNVFFAEDAWHAENGYAFVEHYTAAGIPKKNLSKYENPELEETILAKSGGGEDAIEQVYIELLLAVNDSLPELPIYTRKNAAVISPRVNGLEIGKYQRWTKGLEGAGINVTEENQ